VAQNNLGLVYAEGTGVAKSDAAAVVWFRRAAEQGLPDAQYNLGLAYDLGRGVSTDHSAAAIWYRKAVRQGSVKR
jgi:TPR repeat protein